MNEHQNQEEASEEHVNERQSPEEIHEQQQLDLLHDLVDELGPGRVAARQCERGSALEGRVATLSGSCPRASTPCARSSGR